MAYTRKRNSQSGRFPESGPRDPVRANPEGVPTRSAPREQPDSEHECVRTSLAGHTIVVDGHRTSVRIEPQIWIALRRIAHERRMTLNNLISEIDRTRTGPGLSAAIRTYVVLYLSDLVWHSGAVRANR